MEDDDRIHNIIREMEAERIANQQKERKSDKKSIQCYVSSSITSPENVEELSKDKLQIVYRNIYRKLQNGQKISKDEEDFLKQNDSVSYEKAKSIEYETESLIQDFQNCRTKQEIQLVRSNYLNRIHSWYKLIENDLTIPVEKKIGYILFKDAKVSAIRNIYQKFVESAEYKHLPVNAEVSVVSEITQTSKEMQLLEERKAKCIKAKIGYENFCKHINEQETLEDGKLSSFDSKG